MQHSPNNFVSPGDCQLYVPGQKHPPLKEMDGHRIPGKREQNGPEIYFKFERDRRGVYRQFTNEQGETVFFLQLWWIKGNNAFVQRNYPVTETVFGQRYREEQYHGV